MKTLPILAGLCLLLTTAHAQERAAGGALETQMSWSALTNMVKDANTKTMAAHSRLDQIEKCGKEGMLYAPDADGANAQGCLAVGEGMRWRGEGKYFPSFPGISTPWWRYEKSLKAANVTQACKFDKNRSYPQPDKYVSNTKYGEDAIMGFPCSKLNDRCYTVEGDKGVPASVGVLICK